MLTATSLQVLCSRRYTRFRVPLRLHRGNEEWTAVTNAAAILYMRGPVEWSADTEVPLWEPLMRADTPAHKALFDDVLGWCRASVDQFIQCPECYGMAGHWEPAPYCPVCGGDYCVDQDWCEVPGGELIDRGLLRHYLHRVHARTVSIAWPNAAKRRPLVMRPEHGNWIFCAMPGRADAAKPKGDPFPRGIIEPTNSQEGDEVR